MINGAHIIIYSKDADADRTFFKDVLGFKSVDVGHGWLIFALPPAEIACHPSDENNQHELFLMCEDLKVAMAALDTRSSCPARYFESWQLQTTRISNNSWKKCLPMWS